MTKGILKFWDEDGIPKLVEIQYKPGSTFCGGDCPIKRLYPSVEPVTGNPVCSILAKGYTSEVNNSGPFINKNTHYYFCSENIIVTATDLESEGDSFNRLKRVSLGDLIANVCPGRCVFMEDTSKCTEAHRKCPGCL